MAGHAKVYTLAEVSTHNSFEDCWLVIHGKVYDVTKLLENHPGGDEVLRLATGKDATLDFEDVGHSTSAKAMMDEYYVGEIDAATLPKEVLYTPTIQPNYNPGKTSNSVVKILQVLVPLLILGFAIAVRYFTKSA